MASPVQIHLRDPKNYPRERQCSMRPGAKKELEPLINRLIQHSLLRPCNSPCNTPILAMRKLNGDERLVQDFQIINETVIPLYSIIWNPYTLLGQIPPDSNWFSMLNLKDTFFCIPINPNSQYLLSLNVGYHSQVRNASLMGPILHVQI